MFKKTFQKNRFKAQIFKQKKMKSNFGFYCISHSFNFTLYYIDISFFSDPFPLI